MNTTLECSVTAFLHLRRPLIMLWIHAFRAVLPGLEPPPCALTIPLHWLMINDE